MRSRNLRSLTSFKLEVGNMPTKKNGGFLPLFAILTADRLGDSFHLSWFVHLMGKPSSSGRRILIGPCSVAGAAWLCKFKCAPKQSISSADFDKTGSMRNTTKKLKVITERQRPAIILSCTWPAVTWHSDMHKGQKYWIWWHWLIFETLHISKRHHHHHHPYSYHRHALWNPRDGAVWTWLLDLRTFLSQASVH